MPTVHQALADTAGAALSAAGRSGTPLDPALVAGADVAAASFFILRFLSMAAATAFLTLSTSSLLSSTYFWSSSRRLFCPGCALVAGAALAEATGAAGSPSAVDDDAVASCVKSAGGREEVVAVAADEVGLLAAYESALSISARNLASRPLASSILAASLCGAPSRYSASLSNGRVVKTS